MEKINFLTTTEVAEKLGVTPDCIRKWDESGELKHDYVTNGGHRRYSESNIMEFLKKKQKDSNVEDLRKEWRKKTYNKIATGELNISNPKNTYFDEQNKSEIFYIATRGGKIIVSSDCIKNENDNCGPMCNYLTRESLSAEEIFSHSISNGCYQENNTLPSDIEDDINDIWAFLNLYYLPTVYREKLYDLLYGVLNIEDFIKILVEKNFSGVIFLVRPLLNKIDATYHSYEIYLKSMCEQLVNYFIEEKIHSKHLVKNDYEKTKKRFLEGEFGRLDIIFREKQFSFVVGDGKTGEIYLHVFDRRKFDILMDRLKKFPMEFRFYKGPVLYNQELYVDNLISDDYVLPCFEKNETIDADNDDSAIPQNEKKYTEKELEVEDREMSITVSNGIYSFLRTAKCPECGGDLESDGPTLYNPFTFEPLSVCKCKKCGKTIKTEHAYPRIVYLKNFKDEIKIW